MTEVLTKYTNGNRVFFKDESVMREFEHLETGVLQRIVNNRIPSRWERFWARRNGRGAFCVENGNKYSHTFNERYVPTEIEAQTARAILDRRESLARKKTAERLKREKIEAIEKKELGIPLNGRRITVNPKPIYNDFGYNVEVEIQDPEHGSWRLYMFPREVDKKRAEEAISAFSVRRNTMNRAYFVTEPNAQKPGFNIEFILGEDGEIANRTRGVSGRGLRLYRFPFMVIQDEALTLYDSIRRN